jgi:hypothetical protein
LAPAAARDQWPICFFHKRRRSRNPYGCRHLVTDLVGIHDLAKFRESMYNVWDLHIWKDSALMFCGICRCRDGSERSRRDPSGPRVARRFFCSFSGTRLWQKRLNEKGLPSPARPAGSETRPHTVVPKNESAQDPGLSLARPSNSPPPELLKHRLDSGRVNVNGPVVPADSTTGLLDGTPGVLARPDGRDARLLGSDAPTEDSLAEANSWGSASPSFFHAEPQRTTGAFCHRKKCRFEKEIFGRFTDAGLGF